MGKMMAEQRETVGLAKGAREPGTDRASGLKTSPRVACSRRHLQELADRARKYAAVPEEKFEAILAERRDGIEQENARVTVNLLDEGAKHEIAEYFAEKGRVISRATIMGIADSYSVLHVASS